MKKRALLADDSKAGATHAQSLEKDSWAFEQTQPRRVRFVPLKSPIVCACALFSIACAVGPNHKPTLVNPSPKAFKAETTKSEAHTSIADTPWWEVFQDPALAALVNEAASGNMDVRVAAGRVESARASQRAAFWNIFPTIGSMAGAGVGRGLGTVPGFFPPFDLGGHWSANINASWEVDLWGKLRRRNEYAGALAEASAEDQNAVWVALFADLAEAYFQLRALDLAQEFAEKAIGTRRDTYDLFMVRLKGAVGNDLEVSRAEANLRQAEAQYADIRRAIVINENTIALLMGKPPTRIDRKTSGEAFGEPPPAPPGLPSELLERRPDVRAAKERLIAANAQIGVTTGDYFPRFDLTGSYGFLSHTLDSFTSAESTRATYMFNGVFTWKAPVLGGTSIQSANQSARAEYDIAKALYEKSALTAFREVADALVSIEQLTKTRVAVDAEVSALDRSVNVANLRYRGGVSNYLEVITSQEALFTAQLSLAQLKGSQFAAVVRLYRALGGGWVKSKKGATKRS